MIETEDSEKEREGILKRQLWREYCVNGTAGGPGNLFVSQFLYVSVGNNHVEPSS